MTQTILLLMGLATVSIMAIAFYWNDWITKFTVLAFCVVLANSVYFALDGVKGWPAEEPREVKGTLASVVVINPSESSEGAIYISIFLKDKGQWYEYEYHRLAPKTFYVKYSNSRASEFEKAKKAMQEGQEVRINGIPPMEGQGEGEEYNGDVSDITNMIADMFAKLMPKQKDTYQPTAPKNIEIVEPGAPPQKGTSE
jgi:hypothetical protein